MADAPLTDLIDAYAEARHIHGDHTYNPTTKAARDAVFAALTQAADAGAAETVGWLYTLHMEFGQTQVKFSTDRFDLAVTTPWGRPGRDYSEEYPVTESPAHTAQQLQQAVAREREKWTAIADRLLAHCGEGECPTCSEIICPHGDTMHFHHDGCPTCEQEAAAILQQGKTP